MTSAIRRIACPIPGFFNSNVIWPGNYVKKYEMREKSILVDVFFHSTENLGLNPTIFLVVPTLIIVTSKAKGYCHICSPFSHSW